MFFVVDKLLNPDRFLNCRFVEVLAISPTGDMVCGYDREWNLCLWSEYKVAPFRELVGNELARITAINAKGDVVGWHPERGAFLWNKDSGMRYLGAVGEYGKGISINEEGQVSGTYLLGDKYYRRAFFWDETLGMVDIGVLDGKWSEASAINADGVVVGRANTVDTWHAFIWSRDRGIRDIGTLGGHWSYVVAINKNGDAAGTSSIDPYYGDVFTEERHAFFWSEKNGIVNIGSTSSEAAAMNDRGDVVGRFVTSDGWHAFFWSKEDGLIDLGTLGGNESEAISVNNKGEVAGWSFNSDGSRSAFFWSESTGMLAIGELVPSWSDSISLREFKSRVAFIDENSNVFVINARSLSLLDHLQIVLSEVFSGNFEWDNLKNPAGREDWEEVVVFKVAKP